eukprot:g30924.t1
MSEESDVDIATSETSGATSSSATTPRGYFFVRDYHTVYNMNLTLVVTFSFNAHLTHLLNLNRWVASTLVRQASISHHYTRPE